MTKLQEDFKEYVEKEYGTKVNFVPSSNPDTLRNFSFLEFKNDDESEIYVGEVESNLPNGFGIYYDDECFTIVESKEGNNYGLGLMLIPSVGWSTFKVEDGLYTVLDNSANLSNRQARRKEERRRARQDLLNAFQGDYKSKKKW